MDKVPALRIAGFVNRERGDGTNGSSKPGIRADQPLSLRPRPPPAAPDAAPDRRRQTPQVSAGDHSGQDAKPPPHRLLAARRSAPSSRRLFDGLRANFFPLCGLPRLIGSRLSQVECAQSQRGVRPPIALRTDAGRYRLSFFRPLPRSTGGVQEFEFRNRAYRVVIS